MQQYDVITIGTGSASIIADAAIRQGLRIAIIERGPFGGTCLNRGCIPTKVMVTAANAVRDIAHSHRLGITTGPVQLDWQKMSQRLWKKVHEHTSIREYYNQYPQVDIYEGTAAFCNPHELTVTCHDGTQQLLQGEKIFIGAGARTYIPSLPGLEEVGFVTSETLFGDAYPKQLYQSLLIIGGGPIGCEFAHIFHTAGTQVTLIQHNSRLLPKEDEEISAFLLQQFRRAGIAVHLNQDTIAVRRENGQKVLTCQDRATGQTLDIGADELLVAPGIRPMTDLLHLEHTAIRTNRQGYILTNEFLETSAPNIWALGDINGNAPFRHKANYEAEIIAHNLFSGNAPNNWRWARYDLVPAVTYTYPEVAHIGLTEQQAKQAGYNLDIAYNHYSAAAKGYALGYEPGQTDDGFIKLLVDQTTSHILGVHIIGHDASVLLQSFINLLSCGSQTIAPIHPDIASPTAAYLRQLPLTRTLDPHSVYTLSETMTPHPSLSEITMWTRYYYENK